MTRTELTTALRSAGCVFAEQEAELLAGAFTGTALAAALTRRVAGEPLEHILGWVEFRGLRVAVGPGVFVPRRRSELLVTAALSSVISAGGVLVVVDLCCGCGAVGLALAAALSPVALHAADIDPVAVACARPAVEAAGGTVHQGDLFDALPRRLLAQVDVLVANAPYVPTQEIALMPPEARDHEPGGALDGGADGLSIVRRVLAGAPAWLAPDGVLVVETSEEQADVVCALAAEVGLRSDVRRSELSGTVVVARPD